MWTNVTDSLMTPNITKNNHLTLLTEYKNASRNTLTRPHKDNLIDSETLKYLSSNSEPKEGRFYILPKIHKQGNPGQPIISSNGHPTERISEFVDYHLKPLVQNLPLKIQHTSSFNFRNLDLLKHVKA